MRKTISLLLILILLIIPIKVSAKTSSVQVTLPSFPVTLNGEVVKNDTRAYPLIVYNGITYFPITYYDARFLGLETAWDNNTGLKIEKTSILGGYRDYSKKNKNLKYDKASIPSFKIEINGNIVDNSKEKYPLLTYKNITYFPMTWKWAVEEFGWQYTFDNKKGLYIKSEKAVKRVGSLSNIKSESFICVNSYCYYSDNKGGIYQKSAISNNPPKKIYQLPIWSYGDGTTYVMHNLYKEDGKAMLWYHQGGAAMGDDYYIQLNSDGSCKEIGSGYLTIKNFKDFSIKVDQWAPPFPNNLSLVEKDGAVKSIGDPNYLYGWDWLVNEGTEQGGRSKDIHLYQNVLYILAFNMKTDTDVSRIHKVNLQTNETIRFSELKTKGFKGEGDKLYCISDGHLYELSITTGTESKLPVTGTLEKYEVLNGRVYYIDTEKKQLHVVNQSQIINPSGKVVDFSIENNYLICSFVEESINPYRFIVLNPEGQIVYKTADVAFSLDSVCIENNQLSYIEKDSRNVYNIDLK